MTHKLNDRQLFLSPVETLAPAEPPLKSVACGAPDFFRQCKQSK